MFCTHDTVVFDHEVTAKVKELFLPLVYFKDMIKYAMTRGEEGRMEERERGKKEEIERGLKRGGGGGGGEGGGRQIEREI